jgi:hypothetical protein
MIDLSPDDEALLCQAREQLLPSPEDHARIKGRLLAQVASAAAETAPLSTARGRSQGADRGGVSGRALRLPAKVLATTMLGATVTVGGLVALLRGSRVEPQAPPVAVESAAPHATAALSSGPPGGSLPGKMESARVATSTRAGADSSPAGPSATVRPATPRGPLIARGGPAPSPVAHAFLTGSPRAEPPVYDGPALAPDQIEEVVRAHSGEVKRACWGTYDGGVSSAVETVLVVIEGSGHVSDARASGNNPTVGRCLEREIKRWVFPPSGGQTTLNLPYKFFNQ